MFAVASQSSIPSFSPRWADSSMGSRRSGVTALLTVAIEKRDRRWRHRAVPGPILGELGGDLRQRRAELGLIVAERQRFGYPEELRHLKLFAVGWWRVMRATARYDGRRGRRVIERRRKLECQYDAMLPGIGGTLAIVFEIAAARHVVREPTGTE